MVFTALYLPSPPVISLKVLCVLLIKLLNNIENIDNTGKTVVFFCINIQNSNVVTCCNISRLVVSPILSHLNC